MIAPCPSLPRRAAAPLAALAMLAAGGILLHAPSRAAAQREQAAGLARPVDLGSRQDALSRRLSFLTLGGLRSLTAEILTADATDAWMMQDWPRAQRRWEQITTLAPQRPNYWMRAARDMARNAVSHTLARDDLEPPQQAALAAAYLERGVRFLQDGAAANPQSPLILLELATLYEDRARRPQFAKAAEAYQKALQLGAPPMYRRWVFYNLARIRGREQEALRLGRELFAEPNSRTPTLRCLLFVLQNRLNLPQAERWSVDTIFGSTQKARRDLALFAKNDLRFPITGIHEFLQHN